MKSNYDELYWWGFIVCIAFAVWLSDWVPFRSDYAIYDVICQTPEADGKCEARNEIVGLKTTYKPDRDAKSVVYWVDDQPPRKYDNCAIADVFNWSCPGPYGTFDMINGSLDGELKGDQYTRHASKLNWWWVKLKHMRL